MCSLWRGKSTPTRKAELLGVGRLKMRDLKMTNHQNPGVKMQDMKLQDTKSRTVLDSKFVQVTHPILFHIPAWAVCNITKYSTARLTSGLNIRQPRKKMNIISETRIKAHVSRFDARSYRRMQLLRAVGRGRGQDYSLGQDRMAENRGRRPTVGLGFLGKASKPPPHQLRGLEERYELP